jgi:hypothetical protein
MQLWQLNPGRRDELEMRYTQIYGKSKGIFILKNWSLFVGFKYKYKNIIKLDFKKETHAYPDCVYLAGKFTGGLIWIIQRN